MLEIWIIFCTFAHEKEEDNIKENRKEFEKIEEGNQRKMMRE